MCTAVTYKTKDFYFGRTLDYEFSYGDEITITPRNYEIKFRHQKAIKNHYAIIGMAYVTENYPLYYDAINEKGLCIAGLNFVGNAHYNEPADNKDNITQFEFIPWILSQCTTVKEASGSYGEFLRVDITGDGYGALGAKMYAVKWDYYGNGDKVLASYGTKFAADNWMHKAMGIQLGLTDSYRCQLPKGTDGTGKWKITVYAMGYADTVFEVNATDANIRCEVSIQPSFSICGQSVKLQYMLLEIERSVISQIRFKV